mgnify:CR=1 FL=1
MTLADILAHLADGNTPTSEAIAALRRIAATQPASPVAPAALLKYCDDALGSDERSELRARVALASGDPTAMAATLDPARTELAAFYPPEEAPATPSTVDTIDTFLRTYGHSSPEQDALLERMIFNPVPEYAETLAREESPERRPAAEGSQDALIDAFLAANPVDGEAGIPKPTPEPEPKPQENKPASRRRQTPAPAPAEDSLLSESLAKIFIKQGRYSRAYEIISDLSLKYPKKSIYFADQLRYLRKLMLIQQASESPKD